MFECLFEHQIIVLIRFLLRFKDQTHMLVGWLLIVYHVSVRRMPGSHGKRSLNQFRLFPFGVIWIDVTVLFCHRVCLTFPQHKVFLRQFSTGEEKLQKRQPIKSHDESEWVRLLVLGEEFSWKAEGSPDIVTFLWCLLWFLFPVLFKVYCCDNTYTTIRASVAASARELIGAVAEKLGSTENLLLVSLSSAGGGSGELLLHTSLAAVRCRDAPLKSSMTLHTSLIKNSFGSSLIIKLTLNNNRWPWIPQQF